MLDNWFMLNTTNISLSLTLSHSNTLSLTHSLDIIDLGEQRKMEKDR